ncbi:HvfC/BufC N-terminal domain-containing protein [Leeia aquatica]|uniref:DNA-binding domain-containing protein n=1 Tax=Leeia aquatica TaxID=2725557 RepID=A0A847SE51_9NEIS|nr:putative DNA-binding domain-containing protein [Leeia aquatica]NLR75569.1 hypothetical protein [Leeia aquatica]
MTTSLQQRQHSMLAAIAAADAPHASWIPATAGIAAERRIGVYRHAYRARLAAALQDNYPMLYRLLGDAHWSELHAAYLAVHPPAHYSIRWYGSEMADFLQQGGFEGHPAMSDLARLEWALNTAFDAPDHATLTLEAVQALPGLTWTEQPLALVPSLRLIAVQYAVGPLWHQLQQDPEQVGEPEAIAGYCVVWRQDSQSRFRHLEPLEAGLLQHLQSQPASFSQLADWLMQQHADGQLATVLAQCLQQWLQDGLLLPWAE